MSPGKSGYIFLSYNRVQLFKLRIFLLSRKCFIDTKAVDVKSNTHSGPKAIQSLFLFMSNAI